MLEGGSCLIESCQDDGSAVFTVLCLGAERSLFFSGYILHSFYSLKKEITHDLQIFFLKVIVAIGRFLER